ncbi:MAG TPA: CPBP family glutamic-type intramembrane protease [Gemmatimonadaceae bacterium]|nr:CPBP family glutamic-type intramembrane protease [Gemmatimonadaceae bacterium]
MPTSLSSPRPVGQSYWRASRAPRYSLLFAFPLLLAYEGLAAALPVRETGGVRNGADVLLKSLFVLVAGARGPLIFGALLIALGGWIVWRDIAAHGPVRRRWIFGAMLGESVLLALIFGVVVGTITARLLGAVGALTMAPVARLDAPTRLMVSLGAGLYEELLFRVILVSALDWGGRRLLGWSPWVAGAGATLLGAAIFSAFHYVGPYGDAFQLQSFVFRMVGGVFFSGLYLLRGFGVDAWTHALYDVFILLR